MFQSDYFQYFLQENKNSLIFNPYQILHDNAQTKPVCLCPEERKKPIKRCINNSFEALLEKDIANYVEGFLFWLFPIPHAWNETYEGAWIDFTIPDNQSSIYYGMVIPKEIVIIAATLEEWSLCTGVIQTLAMTRDIQAKKQVFSLFQQYGYINK